jgi:protein-tyrosine phosphatase
MLTPERALRILNLEGGCNFRDLGGYRTRDGRELKWGCLLRAGVLSYFTPADHAHLNQLRVRVICDLRRAEERELEPTRWPDTNTRHLSWEDGSAPLRGIATDDSKINQLLRAARVLLCRPWCAADNIV